MTFRGSKAVVVANTTNAAATLPVAAFHDAAWYNRTYDAAYVKLSYAKNIGWPTVLV